MRDLMADLPPALSLGVLKEVAKQDEGYQKLKEAAKADKKPKDQDMVPYKAVWKDQAKAKGDDKNEGIGVKDHDSLQAETKGIGVKNQKKQIKILHVEAKDAKEYEEQHNILQT